MRKNILTQFLCFALLLAFVFSSCRRNKDCDVVINIQDGVSNSPVSGAIVSVHPKSTTGGTLQTQTQTSTTDAGGTVTFTFELPAILEVDVAPPSPYTAPSSTLIKLEEGRSVNKTIKVY